MCRPNTAATVLPDDVVGTRAADTGIPGCAKHSGRATSCVTSSHAGCSACRCVTEAVPVRYGEQRSRSWTHQTALAVPRESSPLERAYLDCAGDLCAHAVRGHLPQHRALPGPSRSSPRVG